MKGNLWGPDAPPESRPLDVLVYRSRLLGSDPDLVVWGGGNTSVKMIETDFRGWAREVLRIKGSGTDLKTIDHSGFPGVFRDDILPLLEREDMSDEEMSAYLEHCMAVPSARRPSIETLLHAFLPARHVDHVHADAIVTLTNTERGREVVREALGDRVAYVPYRRPGFALAKQVYGAAANADAVVLARHGLVTWGDTGEESYRATVDLVRRAEEYLQRKLGTRPQTEPRATRSPQDVRSTLLALRGRLGHVILRCETGTEFRRIVDREDVQELAVAGPATADHILRIRPWSCVLAGDPSSAIDAYERKYREWFQRHAEPGLAMLDPRPRIFLLPGFGLIASGRDALQARAAAEVAMHTLRVAALGKDVHGSYAGLTDEDLFHVDYWPLELYKLSLAPAPRELQGRVAIVTGAASGIGRATARHLAGLGAQTALLDLNATGLEKTASQIAAAGGDDPLLLPVDLTDPEGVCRSVWTVVETFGGIDALVSNAGIGAGGKLTDLTPEDWRRSMEVNATTHFLVTREVMKVMAEMDMGGSLVYIASKNAFGPGAGFGAYSAAKAAEVQLARIAALEGGPLGIRSNIINPDAVFEDSLLWSAEVREQRARAHGVPVEELENFYAQRNLLKTTI